MGSVSKSTAQLWLPCVWSCTASTLMQTQQHCKTLTQTSSMISWIHYIRSISLRSRLIHVCHIKTPSMCLNIMVLQCFEIRPSKSHHLHDGDASTIVGKKRLGIVNLRWSEMRSLANTYHSCRSVIRSVGKNWNLVWRVLRHDATCWVTCCKSKSCSFWAFSRTGAKEERQDPQHGIGCCWCLRSALQKGKRWNSCSVATQ